MATESDVVLTKIGDMPVRTEGPDGDNVSVTIYGCNGCGSVVPSDGIKQHRMWHGVFSPPGPDAG